MTFTGPLAALNAALNGMRFTPNPNFNGASSLTILAKDLGATGAGGALTDEDTVTVNVSSVNDAPTAAADAFTLAEDAAATDLMVLTNDSIAPDTGETLTVARCRLRCTARGEQRQPRHLHGRRPTTSAPTASRTP